MRVSMYCVHVFSLLRHVWHTALGFDQARGQRVGVGKGSGALAPVG